MSTLVIPPRFCGPPVSGNGGWTAGALASHLMSSHAMTLGQESTVTGAHPWIEVTLRTPPPLDTPLSVQHTPEQTLLADGDTLVAEARPAPEGDALDDPRQWVPTVTREQAVAGREAFPPGELHPFGGCFVCGPERAEGDGLRLFTGRVPHDDRVASPWTPPDEDGAPTSSTAFTWAALDCASAWADDFLARPMVLGRMSARIITPPRIGQEHIVVARALHRDGRRTHAASALYTAAGDPVAVARHIWFAIDPADFS